MSSTAEPDTRFAFGKNWQRFLTLLDDDRIAEAERSLQEMLDANDLDGKRFLDAGSGSGLFSLAARRLGATVHSFDYDPDSVACTAELRRRYFSDDPAWTVEQGSVLDDGYLAQLGTFDVVYSWGVLHHTGAMWDALSRVAATVAPDGRLFVALYNDQGTPSRLWRGVKRRYNESSRPVRALLLGGAGLYFGARSAVGRVLGRHGPRRGMSTWFDIVDWVGGYPFEVAKPEQVVAFCRVMGLELTKTTTCGRKLGCNEFVFRRPSSAG